MSETYTFHCRWSEEDKAYIGTFDRMPSLSWRAQSKRNALGGIARLVVAEEENIAREERAKP